MVAELLPDFLITFRVKNYGQTKARNVRLRWEQFPESTLKDDDVWQSADNSVLFSRGISFLPPGQEITTLFDHFPSRVNANLPMQMTLFLDYEADDGRRYENERYDLDLDLFKGFSNLDRKDLHDIARSVDDIAKTTKSWTDGIRGLRVHASNKDREQRRELRPIHLTCARNLYREQGARAAAAYFVDLFRRRHGLGFRD